ncbi:RsiV family protein [Lachnoclostridium sp.]
MKNDNIVFYFNPYELGPYVSGILEYSMPILKKKV